MKATINRIYRKIFHRGGHGVHSPFVFGLITNVIEDKTPYGCYESLSAVRTQLNNDRNKITSYYNVCDILNLYCFSEREDQLLFRLANHFRPQTIYVRGGDLGLAPLYLTAGSEHPRCVVIEPDGAMSFFAGEILKKYSSASVERYMTFSELPEAGVADMIILGNTVGDYSHNDKHKRETFSIETFMELLQYVSDESMMVISGINASGKNIRAWKQICAAPEVTVTLDLYSLGIVFFNSKLHRRTYKSFVL